MQAEVVEWVDYSNCKRYFHIGRTIKKCSRDTGIIIDAIMWDLSLEVM